jgi:serine/threonine protein kinase
MAAAGDKINGFTLVRQLGAGGMGETWEGVRVVGAEFEQRVAIKVADLESLQTPEGLELFRREASLAASLRHPNIAAVLDVDEKLGCIICELVDGADLRAVLRVSPRGRLNPSVLVYLVGQISRGLSHAHRRVHHGKLSPVVHRDMSPGNVVVDYDGNLKIVDFGIAKAIASADISETIKGKLSYMAPEQAMASRIDGRVDQYALGVMAYEALAGVRPNDGAHDGETLANILSGKHIPLAKRNVELPKGLADVIEKMLSVAPENRYTSMDGVIAALDPYTPAFTVHRELAELVLRARPAQTIVMQNGVFVSRPVAQESLQREPTPKRARMRGDNTRSHRGDALAETDPYPKRDTTHTHPQTPMSTPPPLPLPLPLPKPAPAAMQARDDEPVSYRDTGRPGSGRWQALLAGVGALVLGALSWVFFSADGAHSTTVPGASTTNSPPLTIGPTVPPPRAQGSSPSPSNPLQLPAAGSPGSATPDPDDAVAQAPNADDSANSAASSDKGANDGKSRKPKADKADRERERDKDKDKSADNAAPPATKPAKSSAVARVTVFPWGRVWVDGKLQGSVPPILEVNLSPGTHEIAVGHERPMESRSIDLQAGTTKLVSFDLEGR